MSNNRNAGVLIAVGAVFLSAVLTTVAVARASRNSSGTMSAANGPYIPGTTISSTAVNARFSDIENEITDSLSRSGKGAMTAPLKEADGTVAAPSFTFTTEPGSGLYRIGTNDYGFSVGGSKKHEWTATGEAITGSLGLSGIFAQTLAGTASMQGATLFQPSLAVGNSVSLEIGTANTTQNAVFLSWFPNATAALSTGCLGVAGINTSTLCVDGNAKTTVAGVLAATGGLTVGATGTSITQIDKGSCALNGFAPSTCTATVHSGATCTTTFVYPGSAATSAAANVTVSSTTLTITSGNGVVGTVNYICL